MPSESSLARTAASAQGWGFRCSSLGEDAEIERGRWVSICAGLRVLVCVCVCLCAREVVRVDTYAELRVQGSEVPPV